ncbi:MAG: hypothetical protein FGF52_04365 [Candidatus Brockarchaeota archaeon]|nr:hypothetical protein [Candidatus Brockarchaeota archaeon]
MSKEVEAEPSIRRAVNVDKLERTPDGYVAHIKSLEGLRKVATILKKPMLSVKESGEYLVIDDRITYVWKETGK